MARLSRRVRAALVPALLLAALGAPGAQAATNNIFTVAGTTLGLSGDGSPATAAQLNFPRGWRPLPAAAS